MRTGEDKIGSVKRLTGLNAADSYNKAFQLYAQLSSEEKSAFRDRNRKLPTEERDALLAKIEPILDLLRQGAETPDCDWGLGPLEGDTPMPHITAAMDLGKLAQWAALQHFPSDPATALADLRAVTQLGHHVTDAAIGLLVSASLETMAIDVVRQNTAVLDTETATQVIDWLSNSSLPNDVARAMAGEIQFARSAMEKLVSGTDEQRQQLLAMMATEEPSGGDQASREKLLERSVADKAFMDTQLRQMEKILTELPAALSLPQAKFDTWHASAQQSAAQFPFVAAALPVWTKFRDVLSRAEANRAMLAHGISLLHGEALSSPAGAQESSSLEYSETTDGFELRSPVEYNGKPLTMRFTWPSQ